MSEKKNSIKNIMLHPAKDKYISSYFLPGSSAFCPENLSEATFQSNRLRYSYVNIGYGMVTAHDWQTELQRNRICSLGRKSG